VTALAAEFEVAPARAAALLAAVPPLFNVNTPSILKDKSVCQDVV
jgi:hypothetical protein